MFSKSTFLSMLISASMTSFAFANPEKINADRMNDLGRIVGGDVANPGDYPYFVQMGRCGGALIAPDMVLTAAHCGDFRGQQVIIGGTESATLGEGAQMRFCEEWIMDPKFCDRNYDFALCKLNEPVTNIDSSIKLELNEEDGTPKEGKNLIVMGLGDTSFGGSTSSVLLDVTVPAVSNEVCNSTDYYEGEITDAMLCAGFQEGGKGPCQGDSGGALIQRKTNDDGSITHTHVGVVSWGEGCAYAFKPGVYARTSKNIKWIKETACGMGSIADFCQTNDSDETCDQDLTITLTTDAYASETSWMLKDSQNEVIMEQSFLVKFYKNEQKLCVKSNECYEFTVEDSFGDGMCYGGACGSYSIGLNGEEIVLDTNPSFGYSQTVEFCTSGGSDAPNPTPNDILLPTNCQDSESFEFNNNSKKTCQKWVGAGEKKERKKKCKKDWLGYKVYDWCPETCGKVNLGSC